MFVWVKYWTLGKRLNTELWNFKYKRKPWKLSCKPYFVSEKTERLTDLLKVTSKWQNQHSTQAYLVPKPKLLNLKLYGSLLKIKTDRLVGRQKGRKMDGKLKSGCGHISLENSSYIKNRELLDFSEPLKCWFTWSTSTGGCSTPNFVLCFPNLFK